MAHTDSTRICSIDMDIDMGIDLGNDMDIDMGYGHGRTVQYAVPAN